MINQNKNSFPWSLDWNLLRTFMVVVEQGGITPAANYLGLKQPTISNAITRLEKSLDCNLLNRRPNYFEITEMGHILHSECSSLFGTISQLPGILTNEKDFVTGHISLKMASHVISSHFDEALENFNKRFSNVTYSIEVLKSTEVANRVRQNRATIGICLLHNSEPRLGSKVLFRESFGLFCGPKHRLFGKNETKLSQLQGEDSVAFLKDIETGPLYYISQLRERALLKRQLKGISTNFSELRRMIITNIGIGSLPIHAAKRDVDDGKLWQLPPYSKLPIVDVYLLTNPSRKYNSAETIFVEILQNLIHQIPIEMRTYF